MIILLFENEENVYKVNVHISTRYRKKVCTTPKLFFFAILNVKKVYVNCLTKYIDIVVSARRNFFFFF